MKSTKKTEIPKQNRRVCLGLSLGFLEGFSDGGLATWLSDILETPLPPASLEGKGGFFL